MSALSWLRIARRVPGLGSQPELPNLEALIDAEALKPKDEYHIARWVVPLAVGFVGLATFIPLAITISPLFTLGAVGVPLIGGVLGWIFHRVALRITPAQIRLRKRCHKLMSRLNGLKNILGFDPVLSPNVAAVLEEATELYLRVRTADEAKTAQPLEGLYNDALNRTQDAMVEAMAQMLALAEPDSVAAQESELARGWAEALLEEMHATVKLVEAQRAKALAGGLAGGQLAPLAGLRDARHELARLESAVSELEQEARG